MTRFPAPDWRGLILALVALTFLFAAALTADGQEATPLTVEDLAAEWQAGAAGPVDLEPRGGMATLRARASLFGANPGTGFDLQPGAQACWEGGGMVGPRQRLYPIDLSIRPWGPTGDGGRDDALFAIRYHAGLLTETGWPCGPAAELADAWSDRALRAAYAGECSLPLSPTCGTDPCDGSPTREEMWDFNVTVRRCSSTVRQCVWNAAPGGTAENPIAVDASSGTRARQAEANGWCRPGAIEAEPSIVCGGWPSYYRVTALPAFRPWCEATPEPEPDPAPPPPPPPSCTPYAGSECEEQCLAGRERWGSETTWTREWCLSPDRDPTRVIAAKCAGVCRGGESEPPPPPPPPECPPTAFERGCQSLGISEERCRTLARWISACNPECDSKCFVPGIPSTGETPTEMRPVEESP